MKQKITVMVTGVAGGTIGEQIIKALRLANTKYTIVGCDTTSLSKGLTDADIPCLLPPAHAPNYMTKLIAACKKHKVKALFVGSEPELKVISTHRQRILQEGIFLPINPENVISICMDKLATVDFMARNKFPYPRSLAVDSQTNLKKIRFFPVILKPFATSGSTNVFIAQNSKELLPLTTYLLGLYPKFLVQEYIGTPEHEYSVGILCSMGGTLINSIAVKRFVSGLGIRLKVQNSTAKKEFGPLLTVSSGISQGEIGPFRDICKQCEKIALKLGCRGVMNIQCRFVKGKVYVFEINPRFSGTTSLRALVGHNEPDILVRTHLFGETINKNFTYPKKMILRGLTETIIERHI